MWLSYLQVGVPIGVFLGYAVTAIFEEINEIVPFITWRFSFYTQGVLLIGIIICFYNIPEHLLSTNDILYITKNSEEVKKIELQDKLVENPENVKLPTLRRSEFVVRTSLMIPRAKPINTKHLELIDEKEEELNFDDYNPAHEMTNFSETKKERFFIQENKEEEDPSYIDTVKLIYTKYRFVCSL